MDTKYHKSIIVLDVVMITTLVVFTIIIGPSPHAPISKYLSVGEAMGKEITSPKACK